MTLLTEKFAQRQLILNLRGQIIFLQNNPLPNPNMADARRLPVLKLITSIIASIS